MEDKIKEWKKEFFDKFGADKIWIVPHEDNIKTISDIWAFIVSVQKQVLASYKKKLLKEIEKKFETCRICCMNDKTGKLVDVLEQVKSIINNLK